MPFSHFYYFILTNYRAYLSSRRIREPNFASVNFHDCMKNYSRSVLKFTILSTLS